MKKSKDKNIARIQRQLGYKDSKNKNIQQLYNDGEDRNDKDRQILEKQIKYRRAKIRREREKQKNSIVRQKG